MHDNLCYRIKCITILVRVSVLTYNSCISIERNTQMMMQMKENADKYAVASARKTEEKLFMC
jgi:hypothetical protein